MPTALVIADEVDEYLWTDAVRQYSVDLVLAAGDLPFDYLEFLASALDKPCVFVPGNHDVDLTRYQQHAGLSIKDGLPHTWPGPKGGLNADGRIVDVAGVRIAGLGGSIRYNGGPNQWTEQQQSRRARKLVRAAKKQQRRDGKPVDILLTHSPPFGVGDADDPPHQGFKCLHRTVQKLHPTWLLHGHIHPYGLPQREHRMGKTRVRNVVGKQVLELNNAG